MLSYTAPIAIIITWLFLTLFVQQINKRNNCWNAINRLGTCDRSISLYANRIFIFENSANRRKQPKLSSNAILIATNKLRIPQADVTIIKTWSRNVIHSTSVSIKYKNTHTYAHRRTCKDRSINYVCYCHWYGDD